MVTQPPSTSFVEQTQQSGPAGLPAKARNVADAFLSIADSQPNRICAFDEAAGETSYRAIAELAALLVPRLEAVAGAHVGVMMPNSTIGTATQLAVALAGKTAVVFDPMWSNAEAARVALETDCKTVLTTQTTVRALKARRQEMDGVVFANADMTRTSMSSIEDRFLTTDQLLRETSDLKRALISFFSRSTVHRLGHKAKKLASVSVVRFVRDSNSKLERSDEAADTTLEAAISLAKTVAPQRGDVMLVTAPSSSSYACSATAMALMYGIPTVSSGNVSPQAARSLQVSERRPATVIATTPEGAEALARAASTGEMSRVRAIIVSGGDLSAKAKELLRAAAPNARLVQEITPRPQKSRSPTPRSALS